MLRPPTGLLRRAIEFPVPEERNVVRWIRGCCFGTLNVYVALTFTTEGRSSLTSIWSRNKVMWSGWRSTQCSGYGFKPVTGCSLYVASQAYVWKRVKSTVALFVFLKKCEGRLLRRAASYDTIWWGEVDGGGCIQRTPPPSFLPPWPAIRNASTWRGCDVWNLETYG